MDVRTVGTAIRRCLPLLPPLLCLLLTACGKSDLSQGSAPGAGAGGPGSSRSGSLTRHQARALVNAVNLTAADVPGLHATASSARAHSGHERLAEEQLASC